MGFNCGIVGLPNVGKSTLFNALTKTAQAQAANYPFCTIEPNIGRVGVPDARLDTLAKLAESKQKIPTTLEFVDIAGLVRGASKGEGLGNQFLGHVRSVDAIIHVLRCFEDDDITHVEGSVDPLRDREIIETELLLADLESLEKRKISLEKKAKAQDQHSKDVLGLIQQVLPVLESGKPARSIAIGEDKKALFDELQLLTAKPIVYVCNVAEEDAATGNQFTEKIASIIAGENAEMVFISSAIEAEIASLNHEEQKEFLLSLGLEKTGLDQVIQKGYEALDLITFFTVGPKEARSWTTHQGSTAPQAAGKIHSDFERGFIRAETINYNDYVACGSETAAKEAGKMRQEGKDYIVKDGDIFHFRFNV
ncbi:MAG: redox-regulated ATPase YchF [Rickettsiales bacterium]|nr:redox-regulated ATPase YchF [Rickettsiales bacterium]|tara:strand:+ start:39485 stop:40582 length:1098 start_codon:yes stop_codon:yes gene_type:complete